MISLLGRKMGKSLRFREILGSGLLIHSLNILRACSVSDTENLVSVETCTL